MTFLAQADPAVLLSIFKPILFLIALFGWGWIVSRLDKDAGYYYLERHLWNVGQIACGIVGFGLMLLVPIFFVGYFLGLLIVAGGIGGYVFYRNNKVPEREKWTLSLDSFRQRMEGMQQSHAQKATDVKVITHDDQELDVPVGQDPNVEAHLRLADVVNFAVPRGADRVDLVVDSEQAKLSVRIDGVRYPQEAPEPKTAVLLIDYLKKAAGLDLEDRRRKQTGAVKVSMEDHGRHTLELTTAGSTRGMTLSIAVDPAQLANIPLGKLGLLEPQQQFITDQLLKEKGKVVLVCAPPRQGTTTTLYSLLQEHDPYISGVVTLEDEIAFEAEGVDHTTVNDPSPEKTNDQLASILRGDPDVLMLSRLTDAKMADLLTRSAEDVRVYVPLPVDDTFTAVKAWVKLVGSPQRAADSLGAVVAQRLVRKLCQNCRQAYTPDPAALKKLNLPAEKVGQLFRASGQVMDRNKPMPCPACHGIGYRGRVGVFEVMALDDDARAQIAAKEFDHLRSHLRKRRMLYLQEAALAKVVEGVTDIKEVQRALAESSGKKGG